MSEPRRLDWRTVISRSVTLSALRRQWGLVIGLIAIFGARGGFRAVGLAFAVLVVLVATVGAAMVEWLRTTYAVDADRLVDGVGGQRHDGPDAGRDVEHGGPA